MNTPITLASLTILALGALGTLGFMVHAGQPESAGWFLGMIPFALWALSPYALLAWCARRDRASTAASYTICASAAVLVLLTMALYYHGFIVQPDAQNALLFVFLPLWQLVAALVVSAVSRGIAARANAPHLKGFAARPGSRYVAPIGA